MDSAPGRPAAAEGVAPEPSLNQRPQRQSLKQNGTMAANSPPAQQTEPAAPEEKRNGAGNEEKGKKKEKRSEEESSRRLRFDTLPDAPPGFTVRFGFHCATNLHPADFHTASSDPFLTATLKASNPKRHKEDPDLFHRTPMLHRTMAPEWNDEWVVANVPPSGFTLKCRLDEDTANHDDRLGNVTIKVPHLHDSWEGFPSPGREFQAKKRVMSKRAFLVKGIASMLHSDTHLARRLTVSIELLGRSLPPHAQMYTVGPTTWIKHFSPMIGRLAGTKVNADESRDRDHPSAKNGQPKNSEIRVSLDLCRAFSSPCAYHSLTVLLHRSTPAGSFQANQMQLQGPVPPRLYHRYVRFRPVIGAMFASTGLRGKILNLALHKQHNRVYNFDGTAQYGSMEPCSRDASLQFLRLVHFDEGGRIFTYVLTLDSLFRFTETGKEFGIDLLSKHTMHSNIETYIAFSGEFFIRRLQYPDASDDPQPREKTHPSDEIAGGPPTENPPANPSFYQLTIDNDSGTYRPDKSILPDLKAFLERNFPGLGIVARHWEDEELKKLKEKQRQVKQKEGRVLNVVMNRSQSSISSAESELAQRDRAEHFGQSSKNEAAFAAMEGSHAMKEAFGRIVPRGKAKAEPSMA